MNNKFSCVSIGNEILKGRIVDTNFSLLAKKLGERGYECVVHLSVPDDIFYIKEAIYYAFSMSNQVFTIGGLGPTSDDLTKEAIAEFFSLKLEFLGDIFYEIKKKEPSLDENVHKKYGIFPEGAKLYDNLPGLAYGFRVKSGDKILYALPGPKKEFEYVLDQILKEFGVLKSIKVVYYDLPFYKEIYIEQVLKGKIPEKRLFYLPYKGGVVLGVKGNEEELKEYEKILFDLFKDGVSSKGPEPLEKVVGDLLRKKNKTLSVAESCTGGLLGSRITDIPGSSDYFIGGVIAYDNRIKRDILKVNEKDLDIYGAVSNIVVKQMAEGVKGMFDTDFGLAISGIAGPSGGTPDKPVGTVYMAISYRENTRTYKELFKGQRDDIKYQSTHFVLNELRKWLYEL